MKKINLKSLALFVAISLGTGILASIFSRSRSDFYSSINPPALTPPAWLFPIVWTILYILMGVSAYLIFESGCLDKKLPLGVWGVQLAINFIWTLVFFNARAFLLAFILIVALWILIACMIALFHRCRPLAAYLQIPYFLWVTFAAYLNFAIYSLN